MNRIVATQLAVIVVLIASTCSGQAPAANSNLKLFMPVMGEWVAEVTLQNDVPGFGKKGDNIPVMAKYQWTENRNAISVSVKAKTEGTWVSYTNGLIAWDAMQKKIVGMDAFADGGLSRYDVQAKEGKIVFRHRGTTGEGVPTESTLEYTNLGKDSFTAQFLQQRRGGEKLADGELTVLTRVKE